MRKAVEQWVILARQDFVAAERLLSDPPMPPLVAVHLQQCVEKCLKAILESAEVRIPKSHDLVWLWQLCQDNVDCHFDLDTDQLESLSAVYMDARYPSGHGVMPSGQPSLNEVIALQQFTARFLNELLPSIVD
jgi:HEPN domain-containing protein